MWNGGGETYMWHCTNYMFSSDDESTRKRNRYHYEDDSYANFDSEEECYYSSSNEYDYDYEYRQPQRQTYWNGSSMSTFPDERPKQNRNPRKALAKIKQKREQRNKAPEPSWMADSSSSDDDSVTLKKKPAFKRLKTVTKKKEQEAAKQQKIQKQEAAKQQKLQNLREELVTEHLELFCTLQNKQDEAESLLNEILGAYFNYDYRHYVVLAKKKEIAWCDRGLEAVEHYLNRLEHLPLLSLSRYESDRMYRKVAPYREDFRPNCPLCKERKFSSLLKLGRHIWNHKGKGHGRYRQETEMKDPSLLSQDIQDRRKAAADAKKKQLDEELQAAVMMDDDNSTEETKGERERLLREVLLAYANVNLQAEKKGMQNWLKTGRVKDEN